MKREGEREILREEERNREREGGDVKRERDT